MRKLQRLWLGLSLGVLTTLGAVTPALAQDPGPDQVPVFQVLLPLFIALTTVAGVVVCINRRDFKTLFVWLTVGGMGFAISLFMVDVL